jgi:Nucleotidyl transferase
VYSWASIKRYQKAIGKLTNIQKNWRGLSGLFFCFFYDSWERHCPSTLPFGEFLLLGTRGQGSARAFIVDLLLATLRARRQHHSQAMPIGGTMNAPSEIVDAAQPVDARLRPASAKRLEPPMPMAHTRFKVHPVILAGGSGTRLWPMSREHCPKQLIELLGEESLLQSTAHRLDGLASDFALADEITVVCGDEHRFTTAEQLRASGVHARIVLEPLGRDTAPALTIAALNALACAAP